VGVSSPTLVFTFLPEPAWWSLLLILWNASSRSTYYAPEAMQSLCHQRLRRHRVRRRVMAIDHTHDWTTGRTQQEAPDFLNEQDRPGEPSAPGSGPGAPCPGVATAGGWRLPRQAMRRRGSLAISRLLPARWTRRAAGAGGRPPLRPVRPAPARSRRSPERNLPSRWRAASPLCRRRRRRGDSGRR
jgi:hypothetical protein